MTKYEETVVYPETSEERLQYGRQNTKPINIKG